MFMQFNRFLEKDSTQEDWKLTSKTIQLILNELDLPPQVDTNKFAEFLANNRVEEIKTKVGDWDTFKAYITSQISQAVYPKRLEPPSKTVQPAPAAQTPQNPEERKVATISEFTVEQRQDFKRLSETLLKMATRD